MLTNARSPQTMAKQDTDIEAWYEKRGGAGIQEPVQNR